MRTWLVRLFALLALLGCGPVYTLNRPFAPLNVQISEAEFTATFKKAELQVSFAEALIALGIRIDPLGTQITANFDTFCLCPACDTSTVAYVLENRLAIINFCPRIKDRNIAQISGVVKHELAHILARRFDHLLCETGALMTPQYSCRVIPDQYTKLDVDYICSTGLQGGACER